MPISALGHITNKSIRQPKPLHVLSKQPTFEVKKEVIAMSISVYYTGSKEGHMQPSI